MKKPCPPSSEPAEAGGCNQRPLEVGCPSPRNSGRLFVCPCLVRGLAAPAATKWISAVALFSATRRQPAGLASRAAHCLGDCVPAPGRRFGSRPTGLAALWLSAFVFPPADDPATWWDCQSKSPAFPVRTAGPEDLPQVQALLLACFDVRTGCLPTAWELKEDLPAGRVLLGGSGQAVLHQAPAAGGTELRHLAVSNFHPQGAAQSSTAAYSVREGPNQPGVGPAGQ